MFPQLKINTSGLSHPCTLDYARNYILDYVSFPNLCNENAVRPYVKCVEVAGHLGRIGAREGVLSGDRDRTRFGGLQAVGGVVCVEHRLTINI